MPYFRQSKEGAIGPQGTEAGSGGGFSASAFDERTLRAAFEHSITPMLVIDDSRRYTAANRAASLLLQFSREELLARRVDDLTPQERRSGLDRRWRAFLDRGEARGTVPLLRADGARVEVDHSSTANVAAGVHLTMFSPVERNGATEAQSKRVLTAREREVLTALAGGQTGGEIARQLYIAPDTVRRHVANAREKLEARTRAHAIAEALRRGEIRP